MTIGIKVTTRAPGLENRRYSGWRPPSEVREEADTLSVALAQPHRRPLNGVDDISGGYKPDPRSERLESVLGRFCANWKPRPLGDHCHEAGRRYAEIVREYNNAKGLPVPGWCPPDRGYIGETEEDRVARVRDATRDLEKVDGMLRRMHMRAPGVAKDALFWEREIYCGNEGLFYNILVNLSDYFILTPKSSFHVTRFAT